MDCNSDQKSEASGQMSTTISLAAVGLLPANPRWISLRIRLFFRRGVGEGGKPIAILFDGQNCRIFRQVTAIAARVAELRDQANIRERCAVAETELAALGLRVDHFLQRG